MLFYLAHTALLYPLPAAIGLLVGLAFGGRTRRPLIQAAVVLATLPAALVVQYAAFLLFGGIVTGNWPDELPPAGLLYALAWFSIPASFTTVPMVILGYVFAPALRKPRTPEATSGAPKSIT